MINKNEEIDLSFVFPEEVKDTVSKWENYVPIVEKDGIVTAHLNDSIEQPAIYNELCYTLENTDAKKVILKLNNGGGHLNSFLQIRSAIKNSKATVIAEIQGEVASAATLIALSCDEIIVGEHVGWMSHYYSGSAQGKGNEIVAQTAFNAKELPKMFKAIHKGFFTPREINKLIDGKDFWLNKEEIEERWVKFKLEESKEMV